MQHGVWFVLCCDYRGRCCPVILQAPDDEPVWHQVLRHCLDHDNLELARQLRCQGSDFMQACLLTAAALTE